MVTITYNPHTARDIFGAAFFNFTDPSLMTDDSMIDLNDSVFKDDDKTEHATYYWGDDESYWSLITEGESSIVQLTVDWWLNPEAGQFEIPHDKWNSMVFYSLNDLDVPTFYSMCYWDSSVPEYPKFNQLTLKYTSTSTIEISDTEIEVEADYADHIYNEARRDTSLGNDNYSVYHPNLDGYILREKGTHYSGTSYKPSNGVNVQLNGKLYDGTPEITSVLSGFGPLNNQCIPTVSGESQKLFVSKDLGVGFYNPEDGTVTWAKGTFQGCTCPDNSRDFEYHQLTIQSCLFYYPDNYEVYVSYTDTEGNWVAPIKILSTGITNEVPVVIPSYIDLIPVALIQLRELDEVTDFSLPHWYFYHTDALNSDLGNMNSVYSLESSQSSGIDTLWGNKRNVRVETQELFTSPILNNPLMTPIYTLLCDDILDYPNSDKSNVAKFWYNQLYISFQTFIQSLRLFPDYNCQIMDCGVHCKKEGKRDVFLAYSMLDESTDQAKCVSIRTLPEGSSVDNLLFCYDNVIESIVDGSKYTAEGYTKLQIKHGIAVGYNGTNWEGIL